jgi:hypothetical protein
VEALVPEPEGTNGWSLVVDPFQSGNSGNVRWGRSFQVVFGYGCWTNYFTTVIALREEESSLSHRPHVECFNVNHHWEIMDNVSEQ